jgi:hypothetical protein
MDYTPFWSTVAQVVPVLGIALVLELRSAATNWTAHGKLQRRVESAVHIVNALVLMTIFPAALLALRSSRDSGPVGPALVSIALALSLALLVWNPVWAAAGRANIDAIFLVQRALPWSTLSRARRSAQRALVQVEGIIEESARVIQLARTLYDQARADLSARGKLTSSATEWMSNFAGHGELDPEYESIIGRVALIEEIRKYDDGPTVARANKLRRMRLRSSSRVLAKARVVRAQLFCIRDDLLESLSDLRRGRLNASEMQIVEASISKASEAILAPWPLRVSEPSDG